jgi:hypothetical protein
LKEAFTCKFKVVGLIRLQKGIKAKKTAPGLTEAVLR